MEKFIHIKCNQKCIVSINGTKTYALNKNAGLDLFVKNNCYISIMPQKDEFLPYSFSVKDVKSNENLLVIPYSNNHYDIIFTPVEKLTQKEEVVLLEKKFGSHYVKVINNEHTFISIQDDTKSLTKKLPYFVSCTYSFDNHLFVSGKLKNDNYYCIVFDFKNNKLLLEEECEIVEKEKDKIKMMKNTCNIAKHGIVYEYDKSSGVIDNYSVYIDNTPHITNISFALPYAFLEGIKLQDFNLAKSYLQESYVSNDHLISYFGNIIDIFPNPYCNTYNYTISTDNGFKSFDFLIENGKIKDIEENKLPTL